MLGAAMSEFLFFLQPGLTVLGAVLAALFFWHLKDVPRRGFAWLGASLMFYVINRSLPPALDWGLPTLYLRLGTAAVTIAALLLGLATYSGHWRARRVTETTALFAALWLIISALLMILWRPDFAFAHLVPGLVMGVAGLLQWHAYVHTRDRGYLLLALILLSHPLLWILLVLFGQPRDAIQQLLSVHYVTTCTVILSVVLRRSRSELTAAIEALRKLNATLEERVADREREIRIAQEGLTRAEIERSRTEAREQLLAELHEGLGSSLSLARVRLASGQMSAAEVTDALDQCFTDLHLIIDTLNEHSDSLQSALVDYRWRCERRLYSIPQRLEWQIDLETAPELEPRSRLNILRIVQEALSNALKHAGAQRIDIKARYVPASGICIEIEDDGHGIDTELKSGSGLRNMEKRARNLGSVLRVENRLDCSGTRIFLCVPVARCGST